MLDYKEILRQKNLGYSNRCIANMGIASRSKVAEVVIAAQAANVTWPLNDDVTNEELKALLFPDVGNQVEHRKEEPNFKYIHGELAKPGVTMTLLWTEYCKKCYEHGTSPYMQTQFNEKYRKWARITKATMRIQHKPGEAMQVDWAGTTIPIFDNVTGEETAAYLFVAVLPCSCYAYAEACSSMQQDNWLMCHVHAYRYFGGTTRLLIPDNLKTGVNKNSKYDTILNRSYQEMADYYNTSIVPARVKKPKDKSLAENTVKFASTWIIAALRERKFFSVIEANEAVQEKLEDLNIRAFKKLEGNRRYLFKKEEQAYLQPLPLNDYEPSVWHMATVGTDYLISDGINKYSVPFDLIGEKVDIRTTSNIVEVFYKGTRVASHQRKVLLQREPIVKQDHMPEAHRKYLNYNADNFLEWANKIGPKTTAVIRWFLNAGKSPEQGYKACVTLTALADRYSKKRLENACARIMAYSNTPSVRNISSLLKNGLDEPLEKQKPERKPKKALDYGFTRGANYFKGVFKK